MKKIIFSLILFTITFNVEAQSDWSTKITQSLWNKQNDTEIQFFVYLKKQGNVQVSKHIKNKTEKGTFVYNTLIAAAERTQNQLITILENEQATYQPFSIVNGIWVKGDFELVKKMAQHPNVAHVFYNAPIKALEPVEMDRNQSIRLRTDSVTWGIDKINADDVWALGHRGKGVVIGGQDTGYSWELPNLKAKYRGWDGSAANHNYNWHDAIHEFSPLGDSINNDCGLDILTPCDDIGHGTHTMGTMVATDTTVLLGVAPDAQWIGCRNMEDGWGAPNTYLECFEWFLAPTDLTNANPDPAKAPHVIANSWGCPPQEGCDTSNFVLLETAINNLKLAGVVVVVSAGNDGPDCNTIMNPASIYANSFSVGALAKNDTIAGFSSRGSVTSDGSGRLKPNIVAPGHRVTSYWTQGSGANGFSYLDASGTSMAGPHVAGVVALMISADSTLAGDVDRIENLLEQTAVGRTTSQDCGGVSGMSIPNNTYGYGVIDALAAVNQVISSSEPNRSTITKAKATVFPNPFNHQFWVKLSGFSGSTHFEMYSVDGKLLQSKSWTISANILQSVETVNLPIGVYFYKIYDGQSSVQGKLIKQ